MLKLSDTETIRNLGLGLSSLGQDGDKLDEVWLSIFCQPFWSTWTNNFIAWQLVWTLKSGHQQAMIHKY